MSETGLARKKTKQSVCLLPLLLPTETDGRRRERETERIQLQAGPEAAQHEMSPRRELFGWLASALHFRCRLTLTDAVFLFYFV
jgi:hypothetical protein